VQKSNTTKLWPVYSKSTCAAAIKELCKQNIQQTKLLSRITVALKNRYSSAYTVPQNIKYKLAGLSNAFIPTCTTEYTCTQGKLVVGLSCL